VNKHASLGTFQSLRRGYNGDIFGSVSMTITRSTLAANYATSGSALNNSGQAGGTNTTTSCTELREMFYESKAKKLYSDLI
jgi:hypothetical protein